MKNRNKFSILYILLIISNFAFSQSNNVVINWKGEQTVNIGNGKTVKLPYATGINYASKSNFLPTYQIAYQGNAKDIILSNLKYQAITANIEIANPSQNKWLFKGVQKGNTISFFDVLTFRKNETTGAWEQLVSFTYEILQDENSFARNQAITNPFPSASVLASGDWYKIGIVNEGIYKLDAKFLTNLGINLSNINPKNIAIYGNGGAMLPQSNAATRPQDLVENAIFVQGEADNKFDNADFIYFYGQSTKTWEYNDKEYIFNHKTNLYADTSYYFLTIKSAAGKRIENSAETFDNSIQLKPNFDERFFYESELHNLETSGRTWYGELLNSFNSYSQQITFNFPGLSKDSTIKLRSVVLGKSIAAKTTTINFSLDLNGYNLGTQTMNALGSDQYAPAGEVDDNIFEANLNQIGNTGSLQLTYTFNKGAEPSAVGYIDFVEVTAKRDLSLYNGIVNFRDVASKKTAKSGFIIRGINNGNQIWDISNPLQPVAVNYTLKADSALFTYSTNSTIKEFVAFSASGISTPVSSGKIANQNIHGLNVSNLVIITHPLFKNQAQKIADLRSKNDGLTVNLVEVDKIYNEFSSGKQDVSAIRDFIRSQYLKSTDETNRLKYVLLFGDCSYDYKNILKANGNYVPVYESRESLDPIASHSSDDFFGFMDDTEGNWFESDADLLDIGVGRIPVNSTELADGIVTKFTNYADKSKSYDPWRNRITFIADDGKDASEQNMHLDDAEKLITNLEASNQSINIDKIYVGSYPFVSLPDGIKSPTVNQAINKNIENGTLFINYTGHGGEAGLSSKSILTIDQIDSWTNINKLGFWATATCEFGRYDDPARTSAGELVLVTPKGGGIGLVTTTRPVYSSSNFAINNAFYKVIFKKTGGVYPRLGDVMIYTKNNAISGVFNRNYALLGDPSMRLNYPENNIFVDSINNGPISGYTLKALDKDTILGSVKDNSGNLMTNFNGTLYITVFDKEANLRTLGQNGISVRSYTNLSSIVYSGLATIKNGKFKFSFIVPKDIAYNVGPGKISLYAKQDDLATDASGFNVDFNIGGTATNISTDNQPPTIKLFLNDTSFVSGGTTNNSPTLIAKLNDDNGINITGNGVGHELVGVIDNDDKNVIVLNKYYTATKDNYKSGEVRYPTSGLSAGNHTLRVKAWDTYNNSNQANIEFVVAQNEKIQLNNILNYPNPFTNFTTFHFDHNKAGDDLDVQIQIFTVAGRLIKTLTGNFNVSKSHFSDLNWDGKDDYGDNIAKGVYVYKVSAKSTSDGSSTSQYQKLVILK